MRAFTRPLLAAFLVVAGAAAGIQPANAARKPAWKPCPEDRTAQCATVRVPVDWADPYGASTTIALARRQATDPKSRIGTLFVNPGGPGGSGVDFALDSDYFFSAQLRRRFDIVGFDPRGVSRSNPVVCSSGVMAAAPPMFLSDAVRYNRNVTFNRRLAADCAKRTGPVFGHLDMLSVTQDMDAVRAALGERRISFYGASYGTLLGEQYAERYPSRVRALVLDSVMDHSGTTTGFLTDETKTAQDSFDEFVKWCARSTECALHGSDVRRVWAALLKRARLGTLRDPFEPEYRIRVLDLLDVAFSSFYDPQWHALALYLKEANSLKEATAVPKPGGRHAVVEIENSFPAIFCSDWTMRVSGWTELRVRLARLASTHPQMPVSPLAMTALAGCLGAPVATANPQRRLSPARTGGRVLLINSRHDPATPHVWAERVAAQLGPAATLVTYEGWGHVAYGRSKCVNALVDGYLLTGRTPAAGTTCPGVEPAATGVGGRGVSLARLNTWSPEEGVVEPPSAQGVHRSRHP
ncbi:alpha/beta hydrolase [Winogradskya humida]|uniref:Peptidase n=1 Tax=Winogradskya humida TaxID=113566 RepID=A0ABQ3ZPN2_9ACTN|nr:alpha/beta hydrolase [Actinoplanes humidus]GIE20541.1 peptidase [Actinoplanes humidus]